MYESCDRQSVFGFWILYRVPSDYWHVRFRSLFGATAEDLFQYALRQVFRECDIHSEAYLERRSPNAAAA